MTHIQSVAAPGRESPGNTLSLARAARLTDLAVLTVTGEDARAFLHAQLTSDVANLAPNRARRSGWCSAQGRLLATLLVVPHGDGFFLVLAQDLAAGVAKRLSMFVLRSKVKIEDASGRLAATGIWGGASAQALAAAWPVPSDELATAEGAGRSVLIRISGEQFLAIAPQTQMDALFAGAGFQHGEEEEWRLLEVRAGRALVTASTKEMFVPQMIGLEAIGGVDFRKGCYPGQEVVARSQYRGQLKRRMLRARARPGTDLRPGQELFAGSGSPAAAVATVVNVAQTPDGPEILAVANLDTGGQPVPFSESPSGQPFAVLDLPSST